MYEHTYILVCMCIHRCIDANTHIRPLSVCGDSHELYTIGAIISSLYTYEYMYICLYVYINTCIHMYIKMFTSSHNKYIIPRYCTTVYGWTNKLDSRWGIKGQEGYLTHKLVFNTYTPSSAAVVHSVYGYNLRAIEKINTSILNSCSSHYEGATVRTSEPYKHNHPRMVHRYFGGIPKWSEDDGKKGWLLKKKKSIIIKCYSSHGTRVVGSAHSYGFKFLADNQKEFFKFLSLIDKECRNQPSVCTIYMSDMKPFSRLKFMPN